MDSTALPYLLQNVIRSLRLYVLPLAAARPTRVVLLVVVDDVLTWQTANPTDGLSCQSVLEDLATPLIWVKNTSPHTDPNLYNHPTDKLSTEARQGQEERISTESRPLLSNEHTRTWQAAQRSPPLFACTRELRASVAEGTRLQRGKSSS